MQNALKMIARLGLVVVFIAGFQVMASAQGRGRGAGAGPPAGKPSGGPPSGVGVDRGIGTSSDKSAGRADTGRGTASDRSNGRSDAGLDRARLQRQNSQKADNELRDHPGLAANLHTTANDLRSGYQAALAANPSLKFGQYVAATRLAANLGAKNPNITTNSILAGLAAGDSIGQTLQDLGLSKQQAKDARKRADREIKDAKRR
ncbi:MAG: hypothetical protein AABM67_00410 [Acidobacteriota bacterium]